MSHIFCGLACENNITITKMENLFTDTFTNNKTDTFPGSLLAVSAVSCTLSIIGAIIIFGTYIFMKDIQTFTRKLIVFLTVADFLSATGYLISTLHYAATENTAANDTTVCKVQSYITTYSSLVSFLLTIMIAFHLCAIVVYNHQTVGVRRLYVFNLISWITPGIVVAVAGSQGALGASRATVTGPWCWVKISYDTTTTVMWQLLTGKGWEIMCYLVTTSLYILLKFYLYLRHHHQLQRTHPSLRDEDQNFLYIWLIFYIIRLWGTIRFLAPIIDYTVLTEDSLFMNVLLYMQAFGDPAQSFCNCILFCFLDATVRRRLFSVCSQRGSQYEELSEDKHREGTIENEPLYSKDGFNYVSTNTGRRPVSKIFHNSIYNADQ